MMRNREFSSSGGVWVRCRWLLYHYYNLVSCSVFCSQGSRLTILSIELSNRKNPRITAAVDAFQPASRPEAIFVAHSDSSSSPAHNARWLLMAADVEHFAV